MDNTWVKLYRKVGDNEIMYDATAIQVFMYLLINVDKRTGKLRTGRFIIAKSLKLNPSTVYSVLKRLEKKYQIINNESNNKYTTISLLNWAKYNSYTKSSTQSVNNKITTNQQQNNTIQDIKTLDIKTITKVIQKGEYGNPEINELLVYLKTKLGLPILDDSLETNRRYASLCIKKFGMDKTKVAIDATARSKFWHTRVTSFKGLYYNAVKIVSSGRGEVRSVDAKKVLDSQNEGREGISTLGEGIRAIEASLPIRS